METNIKREMGSDLINKMIAIFMGYSDYLMKIYYPLYASDLNELKKAVDKISNAKESDYILNRNSRLSFLFKKNHVKNTPLSESMNTILTNVIEFIEWHNLNKKL